jgi:hypothetical protein
MSPEEVAIEALKDMCGSDHEDYARLQAAQALLRHDEFLKDVATRTR